MRLRVSLPGACVGYLDRQESGLITFRFDPGYLGMADRPVLGRWFEDHLSPDFVDKGVQGLLPSFFDNYLPEPNGALRELLARRAGVPTNRDFALLAALGEDLPGAVSVVPVGDRPEDELPESAGSTRDPRPHGPLRFSLAGMQLKFSVAQHEHKLTLPVTGVGGRFILKMPSRELPNVPANELLRRLVFVVLCANPDAHLKNWSFFYPDGRRPRLSPAYDLVSTADYPRITTELALRLADERELGRVTLSHFGKLASRAGFEPRQGVEWARQSAERARDAWRKVRSQLPLSAAQRAAIEKHLAATKLP